MAGHLITTKSQDFKNKHKEPHNDSKKDSKKYDLQNRSLEIIHNIIDSDKSFFNNVLKEIKKTHSNKLNKDNPVIKGYFYKGEPNLTGLSKGVSVQADSDNNLMIWLKEPLVGPNGLDVMGAEKVMKAGLFCDLTGSVPVVSEAVIASAYIDLDTDYSSPFMYEPKEILLNKPVKLTNEKTKRTQHKIAMKMAKYGDAREYFEKLTTNYLEKRLKFLKEISKQLKECHSKGMVHRDVKSENVLVLDDEFKLMDFSDMATKEKLDGPLDMKIKGTEGRLPEHYSSLLGARPPSSCCSCFFSIFSTTKTRFDDFQTIDRYALIMDIATNINDEYLTQLRRINPKLGDLILLGKEIIDIKEKIIDTKEKIRNIEKLIRAPKAPLDKIDLKTLRENLYSLELSTKKESIPIRPKSKLLFKKLESITCDQLAEMAQSCIDSLKQSSPIINPMHDANTNTPLLPNKHTYSSYGAIN